MRILILLSLVFGFSCTQNTANGQTKLSPGAFEAMLKKDSTVQLLDVRTPEEFQGGHIPGARNLNFYDTDFAQKINTLDKNRPVMVYCKVGGRSGKAAKQLSDAGFLQVYDLSGGIEAWNSRK